MTTQRERRILDLMQQVLGREEKKEDTAPFLPFVNPPKKSDISGIRKAPDVFQFPEVTVPSRTPLSVRPLTFLQAFSSRNQNQTPSTNIVGGDSGVDDLVKRGSDIVRELSEHFGSESAVEASAEPTLDMVGLGLFESGPGPLETGIEAGTRGSAFGIPGIGETRSAAELARVVPEGGTGGAFSAEQVAQRGQEAAGLAQGGTLAEAVPGISAGIAPGFRAAELFNQTVPMDSGSQGGRLASGAAAGFVLGGPIGAIGGLIGAGISNITNPSTGDPLTDLRIRTEGNLLEKYLGEIDKGEKAWILSAPNIEAGRDREVFLSDLLMRANYISNIKKDLDAQFAGLVDIRPITEDIDSRLEEIKTGITRLYQDGTTNEDIQGFVNENIDVFRLIPPVKSAGDDYLYFSDLNVLPDIDRQLLLSYGLDDSIVRGDYIG